MERFEIVAHRREPRGKGGARKLRAKGLIPGIFYGPKTESAAIVCDRRELIHVLEHGQNVLINLTIRDGLDAKSKSDHVVMVRELQVDPIRAVPIHVDLYEVSMKETMTVEVPIQLIGKPEGTKMGGVLEQVRRELEVECFPADLPTHIEVDVSHLDIGDSIHVRDITAEKVKILTDLHLAIATVVPPTVEKEALPEVEAVEVEAEIAAPVEEEKEPAEEE
jgi:large subunit ribosomal protein L25